MNLYEVFVIGAKKFKEGDLIIAYKQWIWVLNDKNFEEQFKSIQLNMRITTITAENITDPYDVRQYILDDYPQAVIGEISGGDFTITAENYRPSTDSKTLQKMMKALNIRDVTIDYFHEDLEDDARFIEDREQFYKPLAKKDFFHGTSYRAWESIKKKGLVSKGSGTNFKKIKHDDKVFITLNKEKASFHAETAMHNNNSMPMVLELKLPDVDKLITDYDVAVSLYGSDHHNTIKLGFAEVQAMGDDGYGFVTTMDDLKPDLNDIRKHKTDRLSSKLGIFGYSGRIPANHITGVWVDEQAVAKQYMIDEFGEEGFNKITRVNQWAYFSVKEFERYESNVRDELDSEFADEDED